MEISLVVFAIIRDATQRDKALRKLFLDIPLNRERLSKILDRIACPLLADDDGHSIDPSASQRVGALIGAVNIVAVYLDRHLDDDNLIALDPDEVCCLGVSLRFQNGVVSVECAQPAFELPTHWGRVRVSAATTCENRSRPTTHIFLQLVATKPPVEIALPLLNLVYVARQLFLHLDDSTHLCSQLLQLSSMLLQNGFMPLLALNQLLQQATMLLQLARVFLQNRLVPLLRLNQLLQQATMLLQLARVFLQNRLVPLLRLNQLLQQATMLLQLARVFLQNRLVPLLRLNQLLQQATMLLQLARVFLQNRLVPLLRLNQLLQQATMLLQLARVFLQNRLVPLLRLNQLLQQATMLLQDSLVPLLALNQLPNEAVMLLQLRLVVLLRLNQLTHQLRQLQKLVVQDLAADGFAHLRTLLQRAENRLLVHNPILQRFQELWVLIQQAQQLLESLLHGFH
jgi:hypothetical protein